MSRKFEIPKLMPTEVSNQFTQKRGKLYCDMTTVERLRATSRVDGGDLNCEAADLIDRLRSEVERLERAMADAPHPLWCRSQWCEAQPGCKQADGSGVCTCNTPCNCWKATALRGGEVSDAVG